MTKPTLKGYSPEVWERAVRMIREHQGEYASPWEAISSIAAKIGCSGETLRKWVRQAERDQGVRAGQTSDERDRIKALEREIRELRQANAIRLAGQPGSVLVPNSAMRSAVFSRRTSASTRFARAGVR